jgi:hypothetical protein
VLENKCEWSPIYKTEDIAISMSITHKILKLGIFGWTTLKIYEILELYLKCLTKSKHVFERKL